MSSIRRTLSVLFVAFVLATLAVSTASALTDAQQARLATPGNRAVLLSVLDLGPGGTLVVQKPWRAELLLGRDYRDVLAEVNAFNAEVVSGRIPGFQSRRQLEETFLGADPGATVAMVASFSKSSPAPTLGIGDCGQPWNRAAYCCRTFLWIFCTRTCACP